MITYLSSFLLTTSYLRKDIRHLHVDSTTMIAAYFVVCATLCVLCNALSSDRHGANVETMKVSADKTEEVVAENGTYSHRNVPLLQFMHDNFKSLPWNTRTQVNSFSWQSCGSSSDLLVIKGLSVTPDPLSLPGTVGLKFDVDIRETFTSPLKLEVKMEKHEAFVWLPIPCIDDMGSCTYNDLCQKLTGITCPTEFANIPCKCPFTKGSYSLPTSSFSVPVNVPGGKYYVKATLSTGSQAVNCIAVYFSVA